MVSRSELCCSISISQREVNKAINQIKFPVFFAEMVVVDLRQRRVLVRSSSLNIHGKSLIRPAVASTPSYPQSSSSSHCLLLFISHLLHQLLLCFTVREREHCFIMIHVITQSFVSESLIHYLNFHLHRVLLCCTFSSCKSVPNLCVTQQKRRHTS